MNPIFEYDSVDLDGTKSALVILDQTLLPAQEVFLTLTDEKEVYQAIYLLKVRGAPAIGIAAAFGLYVSLLPFTGSAEQFSSRFYQVSGYLRGARPTAVNLSYALDRMERCFEANRGLSTAGLKEALLSEAEAIKAEDVEMCRRISENGFSLLRKGMGILTHCNAGHLAVSRYGTALGPVHLAQQRGLAPKVWVDETRPLLQGARLTAYEMVKSGVDATLICDDMASLVMKQGKIDIVLVGCDRVASNGDAANKIGTSSLAILAKYYGIPFYMLGPSSTIDLNCPSGADIVIEERPADEVTGLYFKAPTAPAGIKVYNPSFDVTPAGLISGIVTEKGIYRPPFNFDKKSIYD